MPSILNSFCVPLASPTHPPPILRQIQEAVTSDSPFMQGDGAVRLNLPAYCEVENSVLENPESPVEP